MDMFISISCYLITVLIVYCIADIRYKKARAIARYNDAYTDRDRQKMQMTIAMVIIIALLFTLYNVLITKMNPDVASDRRNYALNFYGYRSSPSAGLTFIINQIRRFSDNVESLYYVCTLIPMAITLFAYRIYKDATPRALLFLLSTQYVFHTFAGLKQCYANAFAILCIAYALRSRSLKDTICSLISIALAIWFHHTGYFLIPVFVMLRLKKDKRTLIAFYFALAFLVLFLEPILIWMSRVVSPFVSIVSIKINEYFGDAASIQGEGRFTIFKGIPFYIITITGLAKRRELIGKIENYDNYLFLSSITAFAYIATIYNGWVYRLSYFFYFPVGVFYGILMNNMHNVHNRRIIGFMTLGLQLALTVRFLALTYINYGGF